jgi:GT2 family glycosyltransferase
MNEIVSVIIPYHNEGELVNLAIASVWEQRSDEPVEVIVVDDVSDGPPPLCEKFRDVVQVIRSPEPLHAAGARNLGVSRSTGDYVCFLDADDVYCEDRIQSHVAFLREHDEVVMVGGKCCIHRHNTHVQTPRVVSEVFPCLAETPCVLPLDARTHVCAYYLFTTGAVTIRRGAFERVGGFDASYRWGEEWDLQVRLAQVGPIGYLPKTAQRYLCRENSITSTNNPAKYESAARMFRNWRREIPGLPAAYHRKLRKLEHERLLLAAQVYLENEGRARKAFSCSLNAASRGVSVWGLRSLARASLWCCMPWRSA